MREQPAPHGGEAMQSPTSTERVSGGWTSTFSALRHPNYRLFWSAQGLSVVGQTMEFVALGWLVYQLTGSALSLGLTGLAQALPRISLVMLGGAVADRVDRRKLLVAVQAVVAALYFVLATLVVLGIVQVWHVWGLAFVLGALRAFDNPSRQAIIPLLVAREEIPSAVALGNLAWEVPRLVGPATAGVLISLIGLGSTFYVAAVGFILSMLLYGVMRVQRVAIRAEGRNLLQDMGDGLDFVRRNELFAALIGLVFFNSIFGMSYQLLCQSSPSTSCAWGRKASDSYRQWSRRAPSRARWPRRVSPEPAIGALRHCWALGRLACSSSGSPGRRGIRSRYY
ncbi:MAG: MFS transporter [Chloroflexi bacterium]|nr:MFS transporter [Chloroflexota bacterium]